MPEDDILDNPNGENTQNDSSTEDHGAIIRYEARWDYEEMVPVTEYDEGSSDQPVQEGNGEGGEG